MHSGWVSYRVQIECSPEKCFLRNQYGFACAISVASAIAAEGLNSAMIKFLAQNNFKNGFGDLSEAFGANFDCSSPEGTDDAADQLSCIAFDLLPAEPNAAR
jgi:hypothetical protein